MLFHDLLHLSKGTSDLKQKCTQLQHHFGTQFFMLFHMVWSILFRVLALETLKRKFLIGYSRTLTKEKVVSWPNTLNKMNHTMWKSMKNCAQNGVRVCVHFCLRPVVPLERCASHWNQQRRTESSPTGSDWSALQAHHYVCVFGFSFVPILRRRSATHRPKVCKKRLVPNRKGMIKRFPFFGFSIPIETKT